MKIKFLSSFVALIFLVGFLTFANADDLALEGSGNYKSAMSYTFKYISAEKERLYMTYDITGMIVEAPPDSPLYKTSFHALGALEAIKKAYKDSGFIIYNRPNGDKVYTTWQATGTLGGADRKITITFVGGTGECAGIEGGGELTGISGFHRKPTENVRISMSEGKFHWKIPEKKK